LLIQDGEHGAEAHKEDLHSTDRWLLERGSLPTGSRDIGPDDDTRISTRSTCNAGSAPHLAKGKSGNPVPPPVQNLGASWND